MADNTGVNQFTWFFRRLSQGQRIILGVVVVGAFLIIGTLVSVLNRPSFGTLYGNLDPEDASKIVDKLKERNVSYQLEDGGKTIQVPKQQVYDLRLSFAGEGLPHSSVIGYEIFDRANLGVSDFVQKINYRRALEGELARTIVQLQEVEGARVHIVVPEKALFKEDERPATASVVLKLKTGRPLKQDVIQGIAHLVSSSVEGLELNNVTIVDSRGVLLSDNTNENSLTSLSTSQYEVQQKIETYLSNKTQALLEGIVGKGNALVQVSANLDFRQVERTLEQYDPDKTAIRSEQVTEEKTTADTLPPSTRNNTVTNYEVNKTVEHIVENVGSIKRLTIATMINGTQKTVDKGGQKTVEYTPRKQEEMNQFSDIIKQAVGFNQQRGDEVSVVNIQFGPLMEDADLTYKDAPLTNWYNIGEKVFLVVAMIIAMLIVRSLLNRMRVKVASNSDDSEIYSTTAGREVTGSLGYKKSGLRLRPADQEISKEAMLREGKQKRISEYMTEKPEEAVRLLKVWLAEE